jgi:hypothetical protein
MAQPQQRMAATVAAMRTLINHRSKDLCRLLTTEDDYRYDAASILADDGAAVVRPTNVVTPPGAPAETPGRWLRIVYPINVAVSGWNILFTQKVAATTDSSAYADTGVEYDVDYEFLFGCIYADAPSPNVGTPSVICASVVGPSGPLRTLYKPDGLTGLPVEPGEAVLMPSRQAVAALEGLPFVAQELDMPGMEELYVRIKLDEDGKFWWSWDEHPTKDGHFFIARRRRYG